MNKIHPATEVAIKISLAHSATSTCPISQHVKVRILFFIFYISRCLYFPKRYNAYNAKSILPFIQ